MTLALTKDCEILPCTTENLKKMIGEVRTVPELTESKKAYLLQNLDLSSVDPQFRQQYVDFVIKNADIFSESKYDLGYSTALKHTITLRDKEPVFVPQFRIPHDHLDIFDAWVKQMIAAKVIVPCRSPYNSPVFLVRKKNGGTRVVQDLRRLNAQSLEDRYTILDTKECINRVGFRKPQVFSSLDLSGAFWQLDLCEEARQLTAFTMPHHNKQYKWCRAPMGLKGSPSSFSRLMGVVMENLDDVVTYVDDALVASRNHTEHIFALQRVADRLRQHNLKLNIHKCFLGRGQLSYLGFNLSGRGISPDKSKLDAIREMKPPSNVKEVQEVLGLFNYFRSLVKNFSKLAAPLSRLTSKAVTWQPGKLPQEAYNAFRQIQTLLCQEPVAAFPDLNKPYILSVDAAQGSEGRKGGIGAVLSQIDDKGVERMVSCFSRTLRDHEAAYSAFMVEQLAITASLDHFHEYLVGRHTTVYTDHRPLADHSTKHQKTISNLQDKMNEYDIEVIYREAAKNGAADCLSRNALEEKVQVAAISSPTSASVVDAQKRDKTLIAIRNFMSKRSLPEDPNLCKLVVACAPKCIVQHDLLYIVDKRKGQLDKARLWLPEEFRKEAISREHGPVLSGHWGTERTLAKVMDHYWWPSMAADVALFVQACPICFKVQDPKADNNRVPLNPWPQPLGFNTRVHIDLVGPLKSSGPNKHICVLIDSFSKFVELQAIPDKTAETIAKVVFNNWICRYSAPQLLVSDGGREFHNHLLKELLKLTGSKQHVVTSLHPQAQGQVERFNRSLKSYLLHYVDEDTMNWEQFLQPLAFAHNNVVCKSTLSTPFSLVFNHEPTLPWMLTNPERRSVPANPNGERYMLMLAAKDLVMRANEDARSAYERYYNKKTSEKTYKPGDKVLVHYPNPPQGVNHKLYRPWKGLFRIVRVLDKGTVEVVKPPSTKTTIIHMNRIKPFNEFLEGDEAEIDIGLQDPGQRSNPVQGQAPPSADLPLGMQEITWHPQCVEVGPRPRLVSQQSLPGQPDSRRPSTSSVLPDTPNNERRESSSKSETFETPDNSVIEESPETPVRPPPTVTLDSTPSRPNPVDTVATNLFPDIRRGLRSRGQPRGRWGRDQYGSETFFPFQ